MAAPLGIVGFVIGFIRMRFAPKDIQNNEGADDNQAAENDF